jgi:hypothetical protein
MLAVMVELEALAVVVMVEMETAGHRKHPQLMEQLIQEVAVEVLGTA